MMNKVGIGTRVINFLVDTLFILLLAYITHQINKWYTFYYHFKYLSFGYHFFMVLFLYYTFFEAVFSATPGKWLSFSKVVNRGGGSAKFWQILVRSAVRLTIVDMFFIPFLDKTLHDFVSQTEVVEI
jgi:uncharacterized RDD family membrane protein YckC